MEREDFLSIATKAYDDFIAFEENKVYELYGPYLPHKLRACSRKRWAQHYAKQTTGAIMLLGDLPEPGFASWLMVDGTDDQPLIVIDNNITQDWSSREKVDQDIIESRIIFHEVGHIRVSPGMLALRKANKFVFPCPSIEESRAWCYAFSLLSRLAEKYALSVREANSPDDTAAQSV